MVLQGPPLAERENPSPQRRNRSLTGEIMISTPNPGYCPKSVFPLAQTDLQKSLPWSRLSGLNSPREKSPVAWEIVTIGNLLLDFLVDSTT